MARDLLSLLDDPRGARDLEAAPPEAPRSSSELLASPSRKPRDLFAWPDPSEPDFFARVEARGWALLTRFREHFDCALMRSEEWPAAENFRRAPSCACDQCFWRRRTFRDGRPDARGEAARLLQRRIERLS